VRFHVVALPHTQVNGQFSACAFNEKVRKFCLMMRGLGHTVYLYAGDQSAHVATEEISCITEHERVACLKGRHYTQADFDQTLPHWVKFNNNVIGEINQRIQPRDFICIIGGWSHKPVADAFPNHMTVEFGIGYPASFSPYRVFESYAVMHVHYGQENRPGAADGQFFHDVIPSYFEPELFPFVEKKSNYYLYIGRLEDRKGYRIAQQVCEKIGKPLIVAGPGNFTGYGHYVGEVGPSERGQLMSHAQALFAPTLYIGPFESVHAEAQLCGTPVITTDWGVYVETVSNGFNGYRCRMFSEFVTAAQMVKTLDYKAIHEYAVELWSMDKVALRYDSYFRRLYTLWDEGGFNSTKWEAPFADPAKLWLMDRTLSHIWSPPQLLSVVD
jgi:glycosyltransferase involved in cell wall biosynthesis